MQLKAHFFSFAPIASILASPCPFSGPVFPKPKDLFSSHSFQSKVEGLAANLEHAITTGNTSHGPVNPNDTFSIQVFSTLRQQPLLDFHRRGQGLMIERTIDGDSIYRIGSAAKVLTVYLLLLQAGDSIFDDLVVKHLPELSGKGYWDEIRVGALAGYVSGIKAEVYNTDPLTRGSLSDALPGVIPPLDPDEVSPCAYGSPCSREVFLQHLGAQKQVYLPNTTPGYGNAAFNTLGLILESISGLSFPDALHKLLAEPLQLNSTTADPPADSSRGAIVGDELASGWNASFEGAGYGMGAIFSSPNDLSAIGRAILSSALLPGSTTRAWLKPTSHTSSLIGAIGRPWEIFRANVGSAENNRVVDIYSKAGNFQGFGTNFVLIPDYDVGFVIMMASSRGRTSEQLSGLIVDKLLPALEEQAQVEADDAFAGTYVANNGLNSTLVISSRQDLPGLSIDSWISNGTDVAKVLFGATDHFQAYPTNVVSEDEKYVSWRAESITLADHGPFSACPSWIALDRPAYGPYGLDELVFILGDDGKAEAIQLKAFKIVLERQ